MTSTYFTRLGDFAKEISRRAPSEANLPVYSVTKHQGFVPSLEYFKKQVFSRDTKGYKMVAAGELAYATIHLDEGSIGVCPELSLISPMYTVFSVDETKADATYLERFLKSPKALSAYPTLSKGSVHRRAAISFGRLAELPVPLPPLPEQRRIAAILDKADALRAKRRETITKLDQLLLSVFLEMFGDSVTNPKGWPIVALSTYGTVATGNTPPRSLPENYGPGIEWIKSDNLNTRHDYVTQADEQLSHAGERTARVVSSGSILVTCIAGSLSCIGNLAIADRRVAFNQQINAITPHSTPSEFLYFLLKTSKPLIQGASTNGMKGMVNKSKFSGIQLPAPPIELQKEFSRIFLEMHTHRLLADAALAKQEALFAGLQQHVFEGKL
ncbi:restriction endonuclease subunit S [Pseudomonas viridiflava]|uniref:restriction endonuclease subunit S n=1 Tax=Pseudomonas viridiflava TaxID=33069 RepID=UPI001C3137D2|nr:restriction endonuclease subunit S [Pseudomonas viridiflava]QXG48426.1 restriction endonuclease subunit S [Pseudomonas viridiflava]